MVADTRGSTNVMYRATEPAATRLTVDRAASEKSACAVVRVSTAVPDGRSQVRRVWSQEVEYATVGSCGAKITADTAPEWAFMRVSGPRVGLLDDAEGPEFSFRRLFSARTRALGRSELGAGGESDFFVDQTPMV